VDVARPDDGLPVRDAAVAARGRLGAGVRTAQKSPTVVRRGPAEGGYLTDGTRLVQVRRVLEHGLSVEEGPVAAPDVSFLTWTDLEQAGWRAVEPERDGA
jgi:hypothetical protein